MSSEVTQQTYCADFSPAAFLARAKVQSPYALFECSSPIKREDNSHEFRAGEKSSLGLFPSELIEISRNKVWIKNLAGKTLHQEPLRTDPFLAVERIIKDANGLALGYFGYGCARYLERLTLPTSTKPDALIVWPTVVVQFDRATSTLSLSRQKPLLSPDSSVSDNEFLEIARLTSEACKQELPAAKRPLPVSYLHSKKRYCENVLRAKHHLKEGDAFQIVISNELSFSSKASALEGYLRLRAYNPSAYHFLLNLSGESLVGASPERMLKVRGSEISMRLVAGTHPRLEDIGADKKQRVNLLSSNKERAEHLMLIDHARNDVGKVATLGSVKVRQPFSVETNRFVHHLVSEVTAELQAGATALTALKACFPIATLTGTPKVKAMELISEIEDFPRGPFGGAFVALGPGNTLDSTVIIRTAELGPNGAKLKVGAGIVIDSVPEREFEEIHWKAEPILRAFSGG